LKNELKEKKTEMGEIEQKLKAYSEENKKKEYGCC